jgi:hypothetical protein
LRFLPALAIVWLVALPAHATNVSSADPAYPQAFQDIDAEPMRIQFDALINDVDNLWAAIGSSGDDAAPFTVFAGPSGGSPAVAAFRALTGNDLPLPSSNSIGGVRSLSPVAHQFLTGISTAGIPSQAQASFSDIAGTIGVNQLPAEESSVSPDPLPGAIAEYPMTDGVGTTVTDISGSGNTASFCAGALPTWTTYGVAFSGAANQCISTPIKTWGTVFSYYCVGPIADFGSVVPGITSYPHLLGASDGLSIDTFPSLSNTNQGAPQWSIFINPSTIPTSSTGYSPVCGVVALQLGASDHFYVNGVEQTYSAQGASASSVTTTGPGYYLGSISPTVSTTVWRGSIEYTKFYAGTSFTQSQIAAESAWIANRVTPRTGFPVYPTFSNSSTDNVICPGDSLTAGYTGGGALAPWCNSTYMSLNNPYSFENAGVGGDGPHNEVSLYPQTYGPLISLSAGKNICHIWLGTNSIYQSGWTAPQTWSSLEIIGRGMRRMGCTKTIIGTMISRGSSTGDSEKNALNALIRANWPATFDALDDLAAIPALGADGAYANSDATCFNGDMVHLLPAGSGTCYNSLSGYPTVGWNAARVINIMDGTTDSNPTVTTSNAYVENIADNVVQQTPSASATNTLPDCTGLTGTKRKIINSSASNAITVQTSASQTITGLATVAANTAGIFTCELVGPTTGGNYWMRTQ